MTTVYKIGLAIRHAQYYIGEHRVIVWRVDKHQYIHAYRLGWFQSYCSTPLHKCAYLKKYNDLNV